jgi:cyclic beta-1,2-glucan synthetase
MSILNNNLGVEGVKIMIYLYIALVTLLLIGITYGLLLSKKKGDSNILEDVPSIYINTEGLEKHALHISTYYSEVKNTNCKKKLAGSLDHSYKNIIKGYEYIDKDAKNKREIVPAAEWLLDNLYLIEKEYKDIKFNMPESYYKNLPVVSKGIMKGYPRIYHIAVEMVSHTDGLIDEGTIELFIRAYQKNAILTSGELWALPSMLRIALIQNISKIAEKLMFTQKEKKRGHNIANRIINAANDKSLDKELLRLQKEDIVFTSYFVERLVKSLRDNGIDSAEVYEWIDDKLDVMQMNTEKMIITEHQKEAAFQLSIGNSITSIRAVEALNWKDFFEKISYVEKILKKDPLGIYEKMDFESRDYYRHEIEKFSRIMKVPESFVAKKAVECAEEANSEAKDIYRKHIGYYLVDNGLDELKRRLAQKNNKDRFISWIKEHNVGVYSGITVLGILLLEAFILIFWLDADNTTWWLYVTAALGIFIPCSEIILSILNWSITKLTSPRFVPKLSLEEGIPQESSSIVVIPTLINSEKKVVDLINDMEIYYLANMENNLYFALLCDFRDSKNENEPEDKIIVERALKEVKDLNNKYSKNGREIFYFFSRYRKYNEKQGVWMGWERKRGKLKEFNLLLRGSNDTSYNVISGDISKLSDIKYVITLDADTQLPRGSAKALIGAMSHILNKPYYRSDGKRVARGYGLMQPRISVGTMNANKTLFSRIFSGETGIDMYTTAFSDLYQDIFGEGIFTGKGIYDIDVFENTMENEIPENAVLSHDLLEGSYARTALVTDIELVDGYPAYYNSSSKRLHRWVRGDWQLLPWLRKDSPLSFLSKWKMVDNLRRSLLSPSIIVLIILGLTVLPANSPWVTLAFFVVLCPLMFDVTEAVAEPIKGISLSGRFGSIRMVLKQFILIFSFLPYQAYLMLDAVIRTIYRMYVSKRNLLEWQTAADVEAKSGKRFGDYVQSMWIGSAIALVIGILAFNISYILGLTLLPSVIIWFISPYTAYFISRDEGAQDYKLTDEHNDLLRRLSRKTWAYFEDFVNSENNWLAPDNYQEDPDNGVAHRTSPTNIGMGFISCLAAHDLGYIGASDAIDRVDKILTSIEGLSNYKGHLYNWYDTKTKAPLFPRYVSTVDSGNMVCYMWVTSEALVEYLREPFINRRLLDGMRDTLKLACEELGEVGTEDSKLMDAFVKVKNFNIFSWKEFITDLRNTALNIEKSAIEKDMYWNAKVKNSTSKFLGELQRMAPWIDLMKDKEEKDIVDRLNRMYAEVPLEKIPEEIDNIINFIEDSTEELNSRAYIRELKELLKNSSGEIEKEVNKAYSIQQRLNKFVDDTDFRMLYDKKRGLFSIGYDIEKDALNNSYYDLLASEARGASLIAIAKGDIDQKHWFKLGRAMTVMGSHRGLVSWSGTMFEYFMPLLIMKNYPDTLLDETYKAVIEGQKKYARDRKIPWGISESAFYTFDINLNYQYKAFGVPGIGLKRGLANELVIAPYASVMTLQMDLIGAINNIKRLIREGTEGRYGLYEAVDYTKERLPKNQNSVIVKCFMVHHQGMSLMALNNVLNNNVFQQRFHRIPRVKATELLLQERVPKRVVYDREQQFNVMEADNEKYSIVVRAYKSAKTETPDTHILSNGSYSLMISNSGSGYSKKNDMTVYRWREDATIDSSGMFFYIKNINSNEYWSAAYEPCKYEGEDYQVIFSLDKAEFKRKDGNLATHTEIAVSSEDDVEVRRITITNHSAHTRIVEITSFCEVTLAPYNADIVHPTFSNLFIQTEYMDNPSSIIASRRPRAKGQKKPYLMQTVALEGEAIGTVQYETSRLNFIGRGRDVTNPEMVENDAPLLNTVGAVLDPIISMRRRVKIKPGESCRIAFTLGVADSREEIVELARKYREIQNVNRVFELAWTQSMVEMKYLGIKSNQANLYQLMASKVLFVSELMRDREEHIKAINNSQKDLWPYGISGDLPIVLVKVREESDVDIVRQMILAHEYWSVKGLKVDLIIINEEKASYTQPLQNYIRDLIASSHARDKQNSSGGVYLHSLSTMEEDIIDFLTAIARLVIETDKGTLLNQIRGDNNREEVSFVKLENDEREVVEKEVVSYIRHKTQENSSGTVYQQGLTDKPESEKKPSLTDSLFKWRRRVSYAAEFSTELAFEGTLRSKSKYNVNKLLYYNGYGGFDEKTGNYVIVLDGNKNTPAPWINVISNKSFGFHVSESGSAYTWSSNSRENKITPWSNDPISDVSGEALYIRDEITGDVWSITPKPIRDRGEYVIEHGFGYSTFTHEAYGIMGKETMFAPIDERCKLCLVTLKNTTASNKYLSATYYAHMVMGVVPQGTAQYISTYIDREKNYIYAVNPYSAHFRNLKAFLKIYGGEEESFTGSRKEFIGRGESVSNPQAMRMEKLSGLCGAGFDPCLAANSKFELKPGEEKTLIIMLGQYEALEEINSVIDKYKSTESAFEEFENTKDFWKKLLGKIQVRTPDKTMDLIMNGWLMYQSISCRYWSRTAFYQSGGAYGYRDQLQDSMSIGFLDNSVTREQILRSAERQFVEGDVQHWWHPVVDSGIRTRFSDDLLWLPYVTIDYIKNSGDYSILDVEAPYLEDEPLKEGEDERYTVARKSEKVGSIYEHCIKAIERGLHFGSHNIPLMGSGDWNDGMSTVGNEGRGESVWLGWFLYDILDDFKELCAYKGDNEKYIRYTEMLEYIRENMEENAWDGSWYRRAYFDDGTPLGSAQNDECQIDSLAQSWAVISGAAKENRVRLAMESAERYLVKEDKGIILLLTPAFENSTLEPGYIKGYVPGVRENGAQYTHAAVWLVMAVANMGNGDKAWKLFNMINPINHSVTMLECERYKVEPYVMSADVYMREPHSGRGGWSWYTGASGWMFRVGIESILGLKLKGTQGFSIEPNVPFNWQGYDVKYTRDESVYHIKVRRGADKQIIVDGEPIKGDIIPYLESGDHLIEVII